MKTAIHCVAVLAALTLAVPAAAQTGKPVRIVSPFATGSVSDITLRLLGERMGPKLNTTVIMENQPTGGGIAAARSVLNAPADGNTLALLSNASAISVATFKKLPYDPLGDFVPVAGISQFAYLVVGGDKEGARSMRELIDTARAKPGVLNIGTSAPGSTPHLIALLLKKEAGVDFTIVPFRGVNDLALALMRNDINAFINAYGAVRENLRQKQMTAIAATSGERFKLLPDVPTVRESGIKSFDVSSWNGLFAPRGSPVAMVSRVREALQSTLAEPEISRKLLDLGLEVWLADAPQLGERMRSEIVRWTQVVKDAGLETN